MLLTKNNCILKTDFITLHRNVSWSIYSTSNALYFFYQDVHFNSLESTRILHLHNRK